MATGTNVAELAWLIGHVGRLSAARLEMLKSLQSALPRKDEYLVLQIAVRIFRSP